MSYINFCKAMMNIFVFVICSCLSVNVFAEEELSKCLSETDMKLRMQCYLKSIDEKIMPRDDKKHCAIEVFYEYCLGGMYKRNLGDIYIDGMIFRHQDNLSTDVIDTIEFNSDNEVEKVQHIDIGDSDFFLQLLSKLEQNYGKPVDLSNFPTRVKEKSVRENLIYILSGSFVYHYVWSLPDYGISLSLKRHNKKVISSLVYIIK